MHCRRLHSAFLAKDYPKDYSKDIPTRCRVLTPFLIIWFVVDVDLMLMLLLSLLLLLLFLLKSWLYCGDGDMQKC